MKDLSPKLAQTLLKLWLTLLLLFTGLMSALAAVLGVLTAPALLGRAGELLPSWPTDFPVMLKVKVAQDLSFALNQVTVNQPFSTLRLLLLVLLAVAGLVLSLLLLRRLLAFIDRVFVQPFDVQNAADLQAAARLALLLWGSGVLLKVTQWAGMSLGAGLEGVKAALVDAGFMVQVDSPSSSPWLNFTNYDFTWLLAAAGLALLAHVFRQVHRLHLEQQQLKAEQELTV